MSLLPPGSLLLESIRLEDGGFPLLAYHQERVNRSRMGLLGINKPLNLRKDLEILDLPASGMYKLRVLYREGIQTVEWSPYQRRSIESLRALEAGPLAYAHKLADRSVLEACFAQREGCDDVILLNKGYLTDASYANIALFDGRCWWTPAHPLLRGVRRAQLIQAGRLRPAIIRLTDLGHFQAMRLINAMIDLDESPDIPLSAIVR